MLKLTTPRLLVRPFAPGDERDAAVYLGDARTMRYIEPPFAAQQTHDFLLSCALRPEPLVWAVEESATGEVIGHVIFHPFDEGSWELGWVLRSDKCGQGYGTELGRALIAEAERRGIPALAAEADPRNAASLALLHSLGFSYAGQEEGLQVFRRCTTREM